MGSRKLAHNSWFYTPENQADFRWLDYTIAAVKEGKNRAWHGRVQGYGKRTVQVACRFQRIPALKLIRTSVMGCW